MRTSLMMVTIAVLVLGAAGEEPVPPIDRLSTRQRQELRTAWQKVVEPVLRAGADFNGSPGGRLWGETIDGRPMISLRSVALSDGYALSPRQYVAVEVALGTGGRVPGRHRQWLEPFEIQGQFVRRINGGPGDEVSINNLHGTEAVVWRSGPILLEVRRPAGALEAARRVHRAAQNSGLLEYPERVAEILGTGPPEAKSRDAMDQEIPADWVRHRADSLGLSIAVPAHFRKADSVPGSELALRQDRDGRPRKLVYLMHRPGRPADEVAHQRDEVLRKQAARFAEKGYKALARGRGRIAGQRSHYAMYRYVWKGDTIRAVVHVLAGSKGLIELHLLGIEEEFQRDHEERNEICKSVRLVASGRPAKLGVELADSQTVVTLVENGSAAAAAGFRPGDMIVAVAGTKVRNPEHLQRITLPRPGKPLDYRIQREGKIRSGKVTPDAVPRKIGAIGLVLRTSKEGTVVVAEVNAEGPARRAGVKVGDVIVKMQGNVVRDAYDLVARIMQAPGQPLVLDLWRAGRGLRMEMTADVVDGRGGRLGIELNGQRVAVHAVTPGSPADRAGIRPGDVLGAIGGRGVTNIRQAAQLIRENAGLTIVIEVERGRFFRRLTADLTE